MWNFYYEIFQLFFHYHWGDVFLLFVILISLLLLDRWSSHHKTIAIILFSQYFPYCLIIGNNLKYFFSISLPITLKENDDENRNVFQSSSLPYLDSFFSTNTHTKREREFLRAVHFPFNLIELDFFSPFFLISIGSFFSTLDNYTMMNSWF